MLIAESNYRICAAIFLNYRSSLSDGSYWGEWWFLKQGRHLHSHCNMFYLSTYFLNYSLLFCLVSMQHTFLKCLSLKENKDLFAPKQMLRKNSKFGTKKRAQDDNKAVLLIIHVNLWKYFNGYINFSTAAMWNRICRKMIGLGNSKQ